MAEKAQAIKTPIFRGSFVNVFKARKFDESDKGEPKFGLTAVFEPAEFKTQREKDRWKAMLALADEVSLQAFKRRVKDLPPNFKRALRDGAEKPDLDGFGPGKMFCTLSTKRQPGIVGPDGVTRLTDESQCKSGDYFRATVVCYSYDNKGKGVAYGLNSLQFVGPGKSLGGGSDPVKDFSDDELSAEDQEWLEKRAADIGDAEDADGGF